MIMSKVSIVVPAHNEEENLPVLLEAMIPALEKNVETQDFEIVIVNDNSKDGTGKLIDEYARQDLRIRAVHRTSSPGFGNAVRTGLKAASGDIIVPVMADLSDDPNDIPRMVQKIDEGYDIAYGSRFCKGGSTHDYPRKKMVANRAFNNSVRLLFGIRHKDVTNAFKAYRRKVLETIGIDNLEASGFDLTVEIPLKAHVLGFKSAEVPVSWTERKKGEAKLKLSQNGTKYGKRLLKIFFAGNLLSLGDIFKSMIKGSWVHLLLASVIGVLILFGIFSLAGFSQVFELLSGVSWVYILAACVMILMTFLLRTWRWSVLLRSSGYRVHVDNTFKSIMFGWLVNYVLPARVGDFARALTLKTTENTPFSVGLSTIVIERAMDMATLALMLVCALLIVSQNSELMIIAVLALAVSVLLVLAMAALYRFDYLIVPHLKGRFVAIGKSVEIFKESFRNLYRNPQAITICLLLSLPIWLLEVSGIFFAARAVHFDLSVSLSILSGITAFLAEALPTTPAGIGIHEGAITGVLAFFGISASMGTAIALLDHFARGVVIFIFGMISAVHIGFESRVYFSEERSKGVEDAGKILSAPLQVKR
jgi:uncharacterized protein (TIRG00374 family)